MLSPLRLDIDALTVGSPALAPLPLATLKTHLAIDGTEYDDIIETLYMPAAVLWAENELHRTIVRRAHRWVLRDFPSGRRPEIRLPRGATSAVASIAYVAGGATTTMTGPTSSPAGSDYLEDLDNDSGGVLLPLQGRSWPSVDLDVPQPVKITFTAGWAEEAIPLDITYAIALAVLDQLEDRGVPLSSPGGSYAARMHLISGHRLVRWY